MTTYHISSEKARVEAPLAVKRSLYLTLSAVLVGVLIGSRTAFSDLHTGHSWIWLSLVILFIALVALYSRNKTKRFLADAYSSFELSIDGDSLTKKQKSTPNVTLLRHQINRILEYEGKGFRICTQDHNLNIWVPVELEGYEQLKADLLSLSVEYRKEQKSWLRSYFQVAFLLALFLIQGLVSNRFVSSSAAFLIAAWLFWAFYAYYRNPNLSRKGKQQIFFLLLVAIALMMRGFLLLRG